MTELELNMLTARATAAAARHWPGATVTAPEALPGGVSSLTYRATLARPGLPDTAIVLKMAPPGLAPVHNRDVLRQARILRALDCADGVRVPTVLFEETGTAEHPPLFAMTLVAGQSYEPLLDVADTPPTPATVAGRARAAARMLGHLQNLSVSRLGIDNEPALPITDELDRWQRLLATVDQNIAPGHSELYAQLSARIPEPLPPTLLHGDYRLANMLLVGTQVTAIIDWEIWSVGDPRTDLAWLLMHTDPVHRFRHTRPAADVAAGTGMPTRDVLLDEYRAVRRTPVENLDWFLAYCLYKTAATLAVFVKRNQRQDRPEPRLVVAAESLPAVVARGVEVLAGAATPKP
ncbi:aminoglycoside phosphotransferase (APT) family kinase protein [Rhodococcus rhodochrous J45]|uniref:Aminoglycoside phosphotransferase (APT) family kinase protein n=1 Tax=Rhodococcus rhodochrous J45 TaxID=935266 RepID=A0A562E3I5_RHORH|nr:aminoglycoside phosphotransferase (APT) family kinase protein [Rhodococcus rhodochrous J45]